MASRLIRWFFVNLIFALLPLAASLVIHGLSGNLSENVWTFCPELLFLSLMMSTTAFGDLTDVGWPIGWSGLLTFGACVLALCAVWSGMMYGLYMYGRVLSPPTSDFQTGFFYISIVTSGAAVLVSTAVEIFVSSTVNAA